MTQVSDLEAATERHRAGDLAEARRLYEQILVSTPNHTLALFRSGLLELQSGRAGVALNRMQLAADAAPGEARYQVGLGQALQAMQRWSDAALAFETALKLDPAFHEARNSLGVSLQRSGHPARAAEVYRQSLDARPGDAGVMANLGTALRELGALREAVERLRTAAELEPHVASHSINLGITLCQQREFAAAEPTLRRALTLDATNPEAAFNLGIALNGLGLLVDAVEAYRRATALRPDYADAWVNLGNAMAEMGDFNGSLSAYAAATQSSPGSVVGLNNAGCLLRKLGRIADAEELLLAGLRIDPVHAALHDNLGNVYKDSGQLDRAIAFFRRALELNPGSTGTHSNLAYALAFQSVEPEPILSECRRWNARFAAQLPRCALSTYDLAADRRLRIGYVSADFREHCQTLFTLPLLSHHDHAAFQIFCYSSVRRPDDGTARIAALADAWRDVRKLDDEAVCAHIQADRIDILVDLTMHMADGRPMVFARKPAPVQVAWLAYPGTTGIDAIDYRLSDPRLDPPGADTDYSEQTIRLPDTFWCYDPLASTTEPNTLPAHDRGYLTLGCLNNPCKLTDQTLRLWGPVMRRLPGARLLLMAPPGNPRQHLLERLAANGIAGERVDFREFLPRAHYLATYHEIDLGLDTFPYNGHTTSLDSMWMGVPVVTRVGNTCVGRAGLSQLHHLDLKDLACDTDAAFVETAVALAGNLARLSALRGQLRGRMENSPLMDAARFTGHLENAYRFMWRTYRASRSRSSC